MKKSMMILAATVALGCVSPAAAVTIAPGSSLLTFTPFVSATQGTLLASSATPSQSLTFNSTFNSAVYRNTLGTLDFYFQVLRTGLGSIGRDEQIGAFTVASFSGFNVDGFVSGADPDGAGQFAAVNNNQFDGPLSTTRISRSANGTVLNTDFGTNGLRGTENSATYIFRTNATAFSSDGTFGIINGSSVSGLTFNPVIAAVPEPGTWAMMILGFGIAGVALRRPRRIKNKLAFA